MNEVELDVQVEDCNEKTSLHSVQALPPLNKQQPVYLKSEVSRMAFSLENLHVESEGATYLAGIKICIENSIHDKLFYLYGCIHYSISV